jgi:hypothetical protein
MYAYAYANIHATETVVDLTADGQQDDKMHLHMLYCTDEH